MNRTGFFQFLVLISCLLLFTVSNLIAQDACEGNFDCDQDVDGTDAATFKTDFGRSPFGNPCPSCPPPTPVEKTGQTTAFATGDDGDLEKGVAWPNPRFTDNSDGTVTDNLTGLIWLKNANCFRFRTWNEAITDSLNLGAPDCGLSDGSSAGDWRLPNSNELASLAHKGYSNPAVPNTAGTGQWSEGDPFTNVQLWYYWSSTSYASSIDRYWFVYMSDGVVDYRSNTDNFYVWPVRGGQ